MAGAPAGLVADFSSLVLPIIYPKSWFVMTLTNVVGILGRETFLVKVDWVDDWPVFNEGRNITLLTRGRDTLVERAKPDEVPTTWHADLTRCNLELGWYQKSERLSSLPSCLHASGPS